MTSRWLVCVFVLLLGCGDGGNGAGGTAGTGGTGGTGGTTFDDPVAAAFAAVATASDRILQSSKALQSLGALGPTLVSSLSAAPPSASIGIKQQSCLLSNVVGTWTWQTDRFARTDAGNPADAVLVVLPEVDASGAPVSSGDEAGSLEIQCAATLPRPDITVEVAEGTGATRTPVVEMTFRDSDMAEVVSITNTRVIMSGSVAVSEVGGSAALSMTSSLDAELGQSVWLIQDRLQSIVGFDTLGSAALAAIEGGIGTVDQDQQTVGVPTPPFMLGAGAGSEDPQFSAGTNFDVAADGSFRSINASIGPAPLQFSNGQQATYACFQGEFADAYRNPNIASADLGCDISSGLFPPEVRPQAELDAYQAGYVGLLNILEAVNPGYFASVVAVIDLTP
jgi:hypothetical protein